MAANRCNIIPGFNEILTDWSVWRSAGPRSYRQHSWHRPLYRAWRLVRL